MNLLYLTPHQYIECPTVEKLTFFCLMSPDYGETSSIHLADGRTVIVERVGRLIGVIGAGDKTGKYLVYIHVKDQGHDFNYLTTEEANARIRELFNG